MYLLSNKQLEELRKELSFMHKTAPKGTGAWWRQECPDDCRACAALAILNKGRNIE